MCGAARRRPQAVPRVPHAKGRRGTKARHQRRTQNIPRRSCGFNCCRRLEPCREEYGFVYTGGVQAIRAELLLLTERKLLKRISKCFRRSVRSTTMADSLISALRKFDAGLRAAVTDAGSPTIAALMLIGKDKDGQGLDEFTVHVSGLFDTWFGSDREACSAVFRWLSEADMLQVRDRSEAARVGFTIDSVRHTRRLQGKNCATVAFLDPRPRLAEVLGR